jgi:hypothetical protein
MEGRPEATARKLKLDAAAIKASTGLRLVTDLKREGVVQVIGREGVE